MPRWPERSLSDRFWALVDRTGDGCWEWTGARFPKGYGAFQVNRTTTRRANRIAWELTHGPIADGLFVLHSCDNPACCRPDHLRLGDQATNIKEARAKGRMTGPRGELQGGHKLTVEQIRAIRASDDLGTILAARYGVDGSTISMIRKRRRWAHVE